VAKHCHTNAFFAARWYAKRGPCRRAVTVCLSVRLSVTSKHILCYPHHSSFGYMRYLVACVWWGLVRRPKWHISLVQWNLGIWVITELRSQWRRTPTSCRTSLTSSMSGGSCSSKTFTIDSSPTWQVHDHQCWLFTQLSAFLMLLFLSFFCNLFVDCADDETWTYNVIDT